MPERASIISLTEAKKQLYVGVDVGGTNIKIGLVDDAGYTAGYHSVPTEPQRDADDAVARIKEGVAHLLQQAGAAKADVARIGLATPGPMDLKAGILLEPGNLPKWWHFPIRQRGQRGLRFAGALCQRCQRRSLRRVLEWGRSRIPQYGFNHARHGRWRRDHRG